MRSSRSAIATPTRRLAWLLGLSVAGCNPYQNLDGDFDRGPIDPKTFPSAYQGAGYDPSGTFGTIMPTPATAAGGVPLGYYAFPVPTGADPLTLRSQSPDAISDRAPAYIFDGDVDHDSASCVKPSKTYAYDRRTDEVRLDHQGNVFQQQQLPGDAPALPSDDLYQPVYAEVTVASNGEPCQSIHSAEGLVTNGSVTLDKVPPPAGSDAKPTGKPDGKYLALAIVDPTADVYYPDTAPLCASAAMPCHDPVSALGPQRYGWFDHFLVGYIDGGYLPTAPDQGPNGEALIVARPAALYAPNTTLDAMGMPVKCDVKAPLGCIGQGTDVIDGVASMSALRGDPGYSPLCQVFTYTPADPSAPAADPADIDPASVDKDTSTFIYCLQVAQ